MFSLSKAVKITPYILNSSFTNTIRMSSSSNTKIAVVLSGCGVYDGSEVHEASACLVHLSRGGANVGMFAPNINQMHVIDHTKGEPMKEDRNVLIESARIARGKVSALDTLKAEDYDAIVFPGGFGAAKNLYCLDVEFMMEVSCLVHLSRGGANVGMFAPNINQMHVIDHTKGEPMKEDRNVLIESARIARGKVSALDTLKAEDYDAIVFPGGFGAAKNLSTFAVDGIAMKVNADVERVLKEFRSADKPIGLCCISPVLAAKVIPGCEVTVGSDKEEGGKYPYAGTAEAITQMGAKHVKKDVTEAHVDEKNKVVTAPAYMCETAVHEVFDGIGQMIQNVLKLVKNKA